MKYDKLPQFAEASFQKAFTRSVILCEIISSISFQKEGIKIILIENRKQIKDFSFRFYDKNKYQI